MKTKAKLSLVVDNTKEQPGPERPGGAAAISPITMTQAVGQLTEPISEDYIFNKLARLQETIKCANLSDEMRYGLSSVIEAAFILFKRGKPGYHQPSGQYFSRRIAIN